MSAGTLARYGRYLAGGCVVAFAVLGILGVVARSFPVLGIHVSWIDELTRLMLVWMVFLGCGLVSAEDKHFRISMFIDPLPEATRLWIRTTGDILVAGFLLVLMIEAWLYALSRLHQKTTILQWPVALYPLAIATGSAVMLAFTLLWIVRRFRRRRAS